MPVFQLKRLYVITISCEHLPEIIDNKIKNRGNKKRKTLENGNGGVKRKGQGFWKRKMRQFSYI